MGGEHGMSGASYRKRIFAGKIWVELVLPIIHRVHIRCTVTRLHRGGWVVVATKTNTVCVCTYNLRANHRHRIVTSHWMWVGALCVACVCRVGTPAMQVGSVGRCVAGWLFRFFLLSAWVCCAVLVKS